MPYEAALTGFVSGNSTTFAGITNAFTYNKRLQPVAMSANAPTQTVFSIGYDFHVGNGTSGADNGNVFGIFNYKDTTHGRDQTFTYDALNRLASAQNTGTNCSVTILQNKTEYWGNAYTYDAWGNLLQKTVTKCGAEGLSVIADAHNWIHASGTDYQYDAAGNMTYDATAGLSYTFDQENRITGANGYTYTYDGDGNRVRKSNGNLAASGTLYWSMTPGVVAETDLAGTLKSEYVFFDGERVARRDGATGTAGVFYYFSDHLKTASVITDSAGVIKAESDYYPWGGELQFVNNDSNDYKFTGKKRDTETGLDYFGARYYSNGLGRWISADWSATAVPVPYADILDPQSLNLYTYVRNMPTTRADADGHIWEWLQKAINFGKYGHLVTDANLENALNTDAEKYQKEMLKYGVSHNGVKLTEEDFAVMSNKEIADMGRAFNDALRHGDVGQSNDGGETQSQQLPLFPDPGQIGGGHGWNKHQGEFPGWSQNDYKATIDNTIQNPDKVKQLSNGRTAYWNDKEKMVVIHDPAHPDGGTAFRPNQSRFPGDSYLNTLR